MSEGGIGLVAMLIDRLENTRRPLRLGGYSRAEPRPAECLAQLSGSDDRTDPSNLRDGATSIGGRTTSRFASELPARATARGARHPEGV